MKKSESDDGENGSGDLFALDNPPLPRGGKGSGGGGRHHYNGSEDYLVLGDGDDLSSSGEHSAKTVAAEIYSLNKVLKEALPLTASSTDSAEKEVRGRHPCPPPCPPNGSKINLFHYIY
jgi:hypothetical protein